MTKLKELEPVLPSSGDRKTTPSTNLFFRSEGGMGQFVVLLDLKDFFHKAPWGDRNRNIQFLR